MMDWLAQVFIYQRHWIAVGVVLLTATSIPGIARVSFEEDPQVFFRRESPDLHLIEQLARDFGPDTSDIVIVIQGENLFTAASVNTIRDIAFRSAEVTGVEYAMSLASMKRSGSLLVPLLPYTDLSNDNLEFTRQHALQHPLVRGHFLSDDARMTLIIVRTFGNKTDIAESERIVDELRVICDECSRGTQLKVRLSGPATIAVESFSIAKHEVVRIGLVSVIISALIATCLFRRVTATAIAVAGPVIGVVWTLGVMGYAGESISGVTTILPTLLFVIGFSDSIHLILESRRSLADGALPTAAASDSLRRVGIACALTSITTAIGFGSLALAETEGVRRFGITCAYGAVLTFLAVITVVPLLVSTRLVSHLALSGNHSQKPVISGCSRLPLRLIMRYPRELSMAGIAITVLLLITSLRLRPDIFITEGIPLDSDTLHVVKACDDAMGGSIYASVVVKWPKPLRLGSSEVLNVVQQVHQVIDADPVTSNPISILNVIQSLPGSNANLSSRVRLLKKMPQNLQSRFLRADLNKLLVSAHLPDAGGTALEPVFNRIDAKFRELERQHPGFKISLTGAPVVSARNVKHMIMDLVRSLIVAAILIFIIMTLSLRSIRMGVISVIPNMLPLVLPAAMLVLSGQSLRLGGAVAFTLCLGLVVDDTIHFLVRYQQQLADGKSARRAIRQSYFHVGAAIIITSLVFVGGFAAMFVSVVPSILIFAQISCIAILAALIGDLVLLPALILSTEKGGPQRRETAQELEVATS